MKTNRLPIFALLLQLSFQVISATPVRASESVSAIYEAGSNRQNLLFRMKRVNDERKDGSTIRNSYLYPDGKEAVTEEIVLENGKVRSIRIEQKQLGESYSAVVKDGVVHYSRTADGKTKESQEDYPDGVLVGAQISGFAATHWDDLMKGESRPFRIMVVDRQETFGFKMYKEASESDGQTVTLKIKPSSPFISALVKPIAFRFDAKTRKLRSVLGRTTPKLRKGDKWTDLDAELVIE